MTSFKLFNTHIKTTFVLLAIIEGAIFFSSIFIAAFFRFHSNEYFSGEIADSVGNITFKAAVFAVVHLLSMTALGQYQAEQYRGNHSFFQMVSRVTISMCLVSILLMAIFYMVPSTQIGRGISALAFIISLLSIITLRQVFFHSIDGNVLISKVIVFGIGEQAAGLLAENPSELNPRSYQIKGFIKTPGQILSQKIPLKKILPLEESLLQQAEAMDVNEIILALDDRRQDFPTQHLLECKLAGINIIDPVSFLEREQGKVNLKLMNPSWMIYGDGFANSKFKAAISRTFDVVASLSILIITSPALLITALLISLESRFSEPIFYRQQRVGKNGHAFDLLKFRSMQVNAEKNGAQWADQNDVRITAVGKFIRKVRIDELPQIINILKGDMRLVGPRPERPEFVNKLEKSITMYNQRHTVKPGLAGWAQLKYPYGATDEDAYQKLQYDLFYIKNANIVMDFFILLQTIEVVIFGKGVR